MRNLDSWLSRASASAPVGMQHTAADRPPPTKRLRGLRSPGDYRTDDLIDEVRKNRVIWSRDAKGFYSPAARGKAFERVAEALNRRFPELRPWTDEEVERHWRLLLYYHLACLREHGPGGKSHSFSCHSDRLSFMNDGMRACSDFTTFVPRF